MSLTPSLQQEARTALAGPFCICGAAKERKHSFCRGCYAALPHELKSGVWKMMSEGYAEAWDLRSSADTPLEVP